MWRAFECNRTLPSVRPRQGRKGDELRWSTLLCISLLFTVALAAGRTTTPDSHLRLAQARNLMNSGTFAVPDGVGNPSHGNLAVAPDGTRYSVYNPGQILLFVPFIWLAKHLPPVA